MSAGISVDWGGTAAKALGADSFSTITPSLQFGKGMGDLPDTMGWARPLALTGQVGYSVPTRSSTKTVDPDTGLVSSASNPQFLTYGATLQYSMPYLRSSVVDLDLPAFLNHLIPIVEAQFATPVANNAGIGIRTTGTINPGVIWVGNYFQVGVEAIVPINRDSGTGVGFLAQLHLYLDDIFPRTIGQPLFGPQISTAKPLLENRNHALPECLRHAIPASMRSFASKRARASGPCVPSPRQHICRRANGALAVVHAQALA